MLVLVKIENGETEFLYNGEWSIETSPTIKQINQKDVDYILNKLTTDIEPRKMYGVGGEHLSLPSEIHRVSGIWNEKTRAYFVIRLLDLNFIGNTVTILRELEFDVWQWPNGHVIIKETARAAA